MARELCQQSVAAICVAAILSESPHLLCDASCFGLRSGGNATHSPHGSSPLPSFSPRPGQHTQTHTDTHTHGQEQMDEDAVVIPDTGLEQELRGTKSSLGRTFSVRPSHLTFPPSASARLLFLFFFLCSDKGAAWGTDEGVFGPHKEQGRPPQGPPRLLHPAGRQQTGVSKVWLVALSQLTPILARVLLTWLLYLILCFRLRLSTSTQRASSNCSQSTASRASSGAPLLSSQPPHRTLSRRGVYCILRKKNFSQRRLVYIDHHHAGVYIVHHTMLVHSHQARVNVAHHQTSNFSLFLPQSPPLPNHTGKARRSRILPTNMFWTTSPQGSRRTSGMCFSCRHASAQSQGTAFHRTSRTKWPLC